MWGMRNINGSGTWVGLLYIFCDLPLFVPSAPHEWPALAPQSASNGAWAPTVCRTSRDSKMFRFLVESPTVTNTWRFTILCEIQSKINSCWYGIAYLTTLRHVHFQINQHVALLTDLADRKHVTQSLRCAIRSLFATRRMGQHSDQKVGRIVCLWTVVTIAVNTFVMHFTHTFQATSSQYLAKKSIACAGEPINATRPADNSSTWWNMANSWLDGWWMVHMTVVPRLASNCNVRTSCWAPYESRPVVGSSQNKIVGCVSNSVAKARRFFSPPDSTLLASSLPPMREWALFARPVRRNRSAMRVARWAVVVRRSSRSRALCQDCFISLLEYNWIYNCYHKIKMFNNSKAAHEHVVLMHEPTEAMHKWTNGTTV